MIDDNRLFASLYTDEDVTSRLAILVRQRGFDARSAHEADMIGQPDEAQLVYAATHRMVLFSFNQRDYVQIARQWAAKDHNHAGILLSDQFARQQLGELLRRVLKLALWDFAWSGCRTPQLVGGITQETRTSSRVRYVRHANSQRPLKFMNTVPADEMTNTVRYLSEFK